MNIKLELLEVIEKQNELIDEMNKLISDLVNKNAQQENLINELLRS